MIGNVLVQLHQDAAEEAAQEKELRAGRQTKVYTAFIWTTHEQSRKVEERHEECSDKSEHRRTGVDHQQPSS